MRQPKLSKVVSSAGAALVCLCLSQTASALDPAAITIGSHENAFLQTGNANDAYWVEDNRWGAGSITEGTAANQYEQYVGVDPTVGANGEVAYRMKWRWPSPAGSSDVKGYPAILSGKKPGYGGGKTIMLPNGSTVGASGVTPGTFFPLQLPLKSLKSKFAVKNVTAPTGQGQLTYDIWLQSAPAQDASWAGSSITHEIMIPLQNWGNYGGHNTPGGRNPGWYDHDAVIGGRLFHVYATKGTDGALLYNFGQLNGAYGKTGWKMIAFVPDVFPIPAGELDLAAFVNYISTRKDVKGNPWGLGNEYVTSVELGVEPAAGTGDIAVYDYKVSTTGSTAPVTTPVATPTATPTATPVSTPTPTPASTCSGTSWVQGKQYAAGSIVTYTDGKQYVAKFANPGYNPTVSTYYWSLYICSVSSVPAATTTPAAVTTTAVTPATTTPAKACSSGTSWVQGKQYAAGSIVSYTDGKQYVAKFANPGYNPTVSTYYWSLYVC
ncbi:hypothetical protein BH10PSE16_BH10PSE16_06850 [soil metagenome]